MTMDLKNRLLDALSRRAWALARLTAPGCAGRSADAVVTLAAENCIATVLMLYGREMHDVWMARLFKQLTEAHGVCGWCRDHPLRPDGTMCQSCWDSLENDSREAELMVRDPQGDPS